MNHSPIADSTVSDRLPARRRIVALSLGVGGLALALASVWMPWYHYSESPFSALPGCSEPAPLSSSWVIVLTVMAVGAVAVQGPAIGMGSAVVSLLVLVVFGFGGGFISHYQPCDTPVTVPAYGQFVALSGSILAIAATVTDWWWNR